MNKTARKCLKLSVVNLSAVALSLIVGLGTPSGARADEAYATSRLKAMSDYMAAPVSIEISYRCKLLDAVKRALDRDAPELTKLWMEAFPNLP